MTDAPDPADITALYAETPGGFIAARNLLAARLKDAGDEAGAKQVKALHRPTVAAWAVDAVAREHAHDVESLLQAGEDVASAQRQVATGAGADRLRQATEERRALIDRLVRAAAGALETAGMAAPRSTLDKVADTFTAIASDPVAAERVRAGILDKELPAPAGFGDDRLDAALLASVSELPRPDEAAADVTPQQRRKERERVRRSARLAAEATELEAEADRLDREAKEAEASALAARNAANRARRRAETARRKVEPAGT